MYISHKGLSRVTQPKPRFLQSGLFYMWQLKLKETEKPLGGFVSGSDTFVEVGMPRSPSHSANGSELKQMLASCKTSSGKRQAVELLQGTKNSHLQ